MKYLFFIGIALSLFSCGNLQHTNFNKQKFTNLKSQHQNEEDIVSAKDEIIYKSDSKTENLESSTDDFLKLDSPEDWDESITPANAENNSSDNISGNHVLLGAEEYTDSTEKILKHALALKYHFLIEIDSQWYRIDSARYIGTMHSIEGNLVPINNINAYRHGRSIKLETKEYINPDTKFISLHKGQILSLKSNPDIDPGSIPDEKNFIDESSTPTIDSKENGLSANARRHFDFLFTLGLVVFLLAVLSYLMAAFSSSLGTLLLSLLAGGILIFSAWVISLIMISTSKQIKTPHRTKWFKVEHTLAWIVATIGVAVIIGFIALIIGLILGF